MKLVIATRNKSKAREMATILREHLSRDWDILALGDFPEFAEPEETGATYSENAIIKSEFAANATGEICIADDAGLEVEALNGEPGVHSKRFAGAKTPFEDKISILLDRMKGEANRNARFRCSVAVTSPFAGTKVFESTCQGLIAESPVGEGGFGYDSIFLLPHLGRTFAELSESDKNRLSHRGEVLREFAIWANTLQNFATK